jgi:hypothetical protein
MNPPDSMDAIMTAPARGSLPAWFAALLLLLGAIVAGLPGEGPDPACSDEFDSKPTARFVGPYRWVEVDRDSNGYADQLRVNGFIQVNAAMEESVRIAAWVGLYRGSTLIAFRAGQIDQAIYDYRTLGEFPSGTHPFSVPFGGEAIRDSARDGPYTAHLDLVLDTKPPSAGRLDTLRVDSPPFSYREFGEYSFHLRDARERPIDSDGDGLYDTIRLTARLDRAARGASGPVEILIEGGGHGIDRIEYARAIVAAGDTVLDVPIDTKRFHRMQWDGPYSFTLKANDGPPVTIRTRPYRWTQFSSDR